MKDLTKHAGASVGVAMVVVTAHTRFTFPVNPPEGVTVMVEVLPVVAPGAIVTDVPVRVNMVGVACSPVPLS